MILFHGSFLPVPKPIIIRSDVGRDFGFAFYVTEIREQADRWALRKARLEQRNGHLDAKPTVSVYDFDATTARQVLKWLDFPEADMAWLEMVLSCRGNRNYSHDQDIVSGKIADDKVGATVTFVQQGIMRKEDAIERLKFQKINSQIAFCTEHALRFLSYRDCYHPEEEQP